MQVVALRVELEITNGRTLKDKRQVVRSLLDRVRGRFNVSAAEVESNDSPRFAVLAAVAVANERAFLDQVIGRVSDLIASEPRVVVLAEDVEFL